MKENFKLPLTKREARQLFRYVIQAEDVKQNEGETKDFWKRHESIAVKLQTVLYDTKNYVPRTTHKNK